MTPDWLIVGAGFSGATMARLLAEAGERVLVIDKRNHIGGNAYDYVNEDGVRIHRYGPHIFHTNAKSVFDFLSRFTRWRFYEHRAFAWVDDRLLPFPITIDTVNQLYGSTMDADDLRLFFEGVRERIVEVVTAEDQVLSQVGRDLFETFFAGYTRKMWGMEARELDKSVTARIPVRFNHDDRYFTDIYQGLPADGYTALFERMLDHPNIDISLRDPFTPYSGDKRNKRWRGANRLIWTGPIDQYFGYALGALPYRSMRFDLSLSPLDRAHKDVATVNCPDPRIPYTRASNMRILCGQGARDLFLFETPTADGDPYYPIPTPLNRARYAGYRKLADNERNVVFVGRLATYQYLNMDQAIGQAMAAFRRLKGAALSRQA